MAKIKIGDMTVANSLTLDAGENYLLSGAQMDSNHIYVATLTKPSMIVKVDASSFTRVGSVVLRHANIQLDDVAAIASDHAYIYAASYSTPGQFAIVVKATMQVDQVITLNNAPLIDSMVILNSGVFFGTDTAPAKIVKYEGATVKVRERV
jgi:hypothetical protein